MVQTAKFDYTNSRVCKALCRKYQVPNFKHLLPLHMQTAQCKLTLMDTVLEFNAGNRYHCMFKVLEAGHQTNA